MSRDIREIKNDFYGTGQTSDSRLRFLKINNKDTKIEKN